MMEESRLPEDPILILRLQESEPVAYEAFTSIYHRYYQSLYQYIFPFAYQSALDTQDILQTVFVRLWVKRKQLIGVLSLKKYLFRMARNAARDFLRQRKSKVQHEAAAAAVTGIASDLTQQEIALSEYYRVARQAIQSLPDRRRLIFLLSTAEDLPLDEIARRLLISKDVVKKQLYLAEKSIRKYIHRHGDLLLSLFPFLV